MTQANPASAIHIVLGFDDKFWAPAYATMRSICLASHRRRDLVFHLLHAGSFTPEKRADLAAITAEFGATLAWHDLDTDERFQASVKGLRDSKRLGTVIYGRLMLDHFLPETAERAIYIDCDVMVRAPIENLWATDLEGHSIAAVQDAWYPFVSMGRDIRTNTDLFDPADDYFNSGLILIDIAKWREAGVWARLQAFIADGTMARIYYDQDVLNLVFRGKWKSLDLRWNIIDPRRPHQALHPFMLHYTGKRKPWNLWSGVAFARLYRHVMTNDLFWRFFRFRWQRRLNNMLPKALRGRR